MSERPKETGRKDRDRGQAERLRDRLPWIARAEQEDIEEHAEGREHQPAAAAGQRTS